MDPKTAVLGAAVLGYAHQWLRGFAQIPTWLSWLIMGLVACGVYVWQTPGFEHQLSAASWRDAVAGLVVFLLAQRGAAGTASDVNAAPKTDAIK